MHCLSCEWTNGWGQQEERNTWAADIPAGAPGCRHRLFYREICWKRSNSAYLSSMSSPLGREALMYTLNWTCKRGYTYIHIYIYSEIYHLSSYKTWRLTFVWYSNGFRATCNFTTLILYTKFEQLSSEFWEETFQNSKCSPKADHTGRHFWRIHWLQKEFRSLCLTPVIWQQSWHQLSDRLSFRGAVKPADKRRRDSASTELQYWSQNVCVKMEDVRVPQNWSQSNMIALWWLVAHFYLQPLLPFL